MRTLVALARATHALPTMAVTAFVTATAVSSGLSAARTALLGTAILAGQASIGWANDAVDADVDRRAGRRDKPVALGVVDARLVGRCAVTALVADVPLSLALGWRPGAAHLVAVGSGWVYDLRAKTSVGSWAPYALSFGLLPVVIATALPGHPLPRGGIVAAAALLGVAAHFANTVPDVAADAATGVSGLPQRWGPAASTVVAATLVAAAAGLLLLATSVTTLGVVATAVAVAVLAAVARSTRDRDGAGHALAFRALLLAVALLVVAFVVEGGHRLTAH